MKDAVLYLKWLDILCAVMGLFGISVLVVGYKDPSFGRVATIFGLFSVSIVLGLLVKRKSSLLR